MLQRFQRNLTRTILSLVLVLSSIQAVAWDVPDLPSEFKLTERFFAWTHTFDITSDRGNLGTVVKKFLSWGSTFTYKDAAGNKVATAKARVFSWGTHIDVHDAEDRKIGAIKEQVWKSLFKFTTTYSILDADDKQIGESEKVDWVGTNFSLTDRKGRLIATIERPFWRWRDTWTVRIGDAKAVDPRIIIMIGVYKSDVDHARAASSSSSD